MSSYYYFDVENSLQIMIKQATPQTMGQEVEIYMSDYQETGDGFLMPFVLDTQLDGQSIQKLSFSAITINEDITDDVFRFPGETVPVVN
jgi:outer membrane lipoprotein-sorting protein